MGLRAVVGPDWLCNDLFGLSVETGVDLDRTVVLDSMSGSSGPSRGSSVPTCYPTPSYPVLLLSIASQTRTTPKKQTLLRFLRKLFAVMSTTMTAY